jgi:gliding motility-associated-like protein
MFHLRTILATLLLFNCCNELLAQAPPVIHWQKCFGGSDIDGGKVVRATPDGGYILGGGTGSNDGDITGFYGGHDIAIFKLDASGNVQWKKCYGGSGNDHLQDMLLTADGGYILLGASNSNDIEVSGNHGDYDSWVVKISAAGAIEWKKSYGGPGREAFTYSKIVASPGGGFVISTITTANGGDVSGYHPPATSNEDLDIWVFKIDDSGNLLWQRCIGGTKNESPGALVATSGGYIVGGTSSSQGGDVSCIFSPGQTGVGWVIKLDELGNILWQRCLEANGNVISGEQTSDGGFIFSGANTGPGGVANFYLLKTDANVVKQWDRSFGGFEYDVSQDVVETSDGGFVLTGNVSRAQDIVCQNKGGFDIWVIKTDAVGELVWQQSYGGSSPEDAYCIIETNDGGFLLTGLTVSTDGDVDVPNRMGYTDMWLVKLGFPGIEVLPTIAIELKTADLCPGKEALFVATITDGGSSPVFQWQVNGANVGTNNDSLLLNDYDDGDIVTCILTSNSPCVTTKTVLSDEIEIAIDPMLTPGNFLGVDTIICEFGRVELIPLASFKTYLWSNSAVTPTIKAARPGVYWLDVMTDKGCPGSDTIIVNYKEDCVKGFYMPTAFTPNNDGNNDLIRPIIGGGVLQQYHFTIMNRWGEIVFRTTERTKGWDGRYKGMDQNSAAFIWTCTFQIEGQPLRMEKGSFVLMR